MMYSNKTKYNLIFPCLIFCLILIDLGQFFVAGTIIIPSLICFYITCFLHDSHYILLIVIALLQCLETFCFYNFFSLACLYLTPITILGLFFKKNLYPSPLHGIILAMLGAAVQTYALEGYFLHIWPTNNYTIMRFSGTLFMMICFSLTINIWGVQDNRG
jgi:hypothetical protein